MAKIHTDVASIYHAIQIMKQCMCGDAASKITAYMYVHCFNARDIVYIVSTLISNNGHPASIIIINLVSE